jgi:hypothetical protein
MQEDVKHWGYGQHSSEEKNECNGSDIKYEINSIYISFLIYLKLKR